MHMLRRKCGAMDQKPTSTRPHAMSISGHFRTHAPQQGKAYSIISSAIASKPAGIVSPKVLCLEMIRNLKGEISMPFA